MQLCFRNSYTSPVWVAVGWYDPSGCAGDAGEWGKRGWWQVNPGSTVTTNVSTSNENFYSTQKLRTAPYGVVHL